MALRERLEGARTRGSRCPAATCGRPMSCCDQLHRREHRPLRAADAEASAAAPAAAPSSAAAASRRCGIAVAASAAPREASRLRQRSCATNFARPRTERLDGVFAGHVQQVLAVQLASGRRRGAGACAISCSMNSGWPSSSTSTAACRRRIRRSPPAPAGTTTFSARIGMSLAPNASARPSCCSARISALYRPPCTMMPTLARAAREHLVQLVLGDEAARRRACARRT